MKRLLQFLFLMVLSGCVAVDRGCSSCSAQQFGADWIIVQYNAAGEPINCWQERNVGVANEQQSDGIFWVGRGGHLIHVSGWHNRVQVQGGDFEGAAKAVGVELSRCVGGRYGPKKEPAPAPAPAAPTRGPLEDKLDKQY